MKKLLSSFSPLVAASVARQTILSAGWDDYLYNFEFYQMIDLKVASVGSTCSADLDATNLANQNTDVNKHCFGYSTNAVSSCGGATA